MSKALSSQLAHLTALNRQAEAVFTLVLLEGLGAAPRRNHLSRLEEYSLLNLVVLPLDSRLVHDHIVFDEPWVENLLVNGCIKHILEHLTQEMVHLLVIPLEFMALLHKHILDALTINRPVYEGNLIDGKGRRREVLQRILLTLQEHQIILSALRVFEWLLENVGVVSVRIV